MPVPKGEGCKSLQTLETTLEVSGSVPLPGTNSACSSYLTPAGTNQHMSIFRGS